MPDDSPEANSASEISQSNYENKYAGIVASAMDAIIAADGEQHITIFNAAAEKMFLCSAEQVIGKPISVLIPDRFHKIHGTHMQGFATGGSTNRAMGHLKPLSAIRANGQEFPIEASISHLVSNDEHVFTVILRDITERIRLEEHSIRLTDELRSANQTLTQQIEHRRAAESALLAAHEELRLHSKEMERASVAKRLLGELGEFLQSCVSSAEARDVAEHSLAALFPESAGVVYLNCEFGSALETFAKWNSANLTSHETLDPNECWALRRGRPHEVKGTDAKTRCAHLDAMQENNSMRVSICVPMLAQGQPLGLFHMTWQEKGDLESNRVQSQEGAVSVAETLALAIANVRLREKLRDQSIRDPLTQLYNRRYLEDVVYREISRARRLGVPIGVIMIDVDNFKQFNDSFGHPAGDRLLHKLGAYLKSRVRSEDVPARYGGEEFVVILPGASCEIVRARAEALREGFFKSVASSIEGLEQLDGGLSVSCGVALFPDHGTNVQEVFRAADQALYEAKRSGKDRVVVSASRIEVPAPSVIVA